MFKGFKLKTIDIEVYELSKMLTGDEETPTFGIKYLEKNKLDYTIGSLHKIEEYLDKVKKLSEFVDNYNRIVLRVGAYVGEVIKKSSKYEYHWYDYDNAVKINNQVKDYGKQIGLVAVLYSKEKNNLLFPLVKVSKYIDNGSGDSLVFYAQAFTEQ